MAGLGREHQLEQCRVIQREAHVCPGYSPESILRPVPVIGESLPDRCRQERESANGERIEQRLTIAEMPFRRAVAHACPPCQLSQRDRRQALLGEQGLRLLKECVPQGAVVVRAAHTRILARCRSLTTL